MARKHLLAGLGGSELPAGNSDGDPAVDEAPRTRHAPLGPFANPGMRGAIGAVTRSLEHLKSQSVVELRPDAIEASPIADRLPGTAEDHAQLVASIREHGQQVPILVRPHPTLEGRYQIAYGRRRLRALAELGISVRSVVKPMTDEQLVIAQGMENTARADLSFIERALFAASLEDGGFGRETIMAALSVDKTGLSRLISTASRVPKTFVVAIGPSPKAGRDRWLELASRLDRPGARSRAAALVESGEFIRKTSDNRFGMLFDALAPKRPKVGGPVIRSREGLPLARVRTDARTTTLTFDKNANEAFSSYLIERLPDLHAAFKDQAGSRGRG